MVGSDKYNAINNSEPNYSAISASFYTLVAQTEGQKMVAMSENDTIPTLDNLVNDKAYWLYFCPWYQRYLTELTGKDELKELYTSDYCITLDELPDLSTYPLDGMPEPETKPTTEAPDTTEATETTEAPNTEDTTSAPAETTGKDAVIGDVTLDGAVDIMDVIALNKFLLGSETLSDEAKAAGDADGNGSLDSTDSLNILKFVVEIVSELPIQ